MGSVAPNAAQQGSDKSLLFSGLPPICLACKGGGVLALQIRLKAGRSLSAPKRKHIISSRLNIQRHAAIACAHVASWFALAANGDNLLAAGKPQLVFAVQGCMQHRGGCFSILPCQVYGHATAGAQADEVSGGPLVGKRRQQANLTGVALQQHLCHSRGAAEVAVDQKWWMIIEHVGQGGLAQQ